MSGKKSQNPELPFLCLGSQSYESQMNLVKFIHSEKATKFFAISTIIFDCHYLRKIYGGDFAKICGLLRIYELYFCCLWADWDIGGIIKNSKIIIKNIDI
jgi:hypothetical protein